MTPPAADIGVFGGSGFYEFLDDASEVHIETPYGDPSAPAVIGSIGPRSVAFIPRHGVDHEFPPHAIPARANLWAMRELGVRAIFGPSASGSLCPEFAPGDFVVCDQLVDQTSGRPDTYWDIGGDIDHVSLADPYDPTLRQIAVEACRAEGVRVHDGGTVVVINGPRFATRAESRFYRQMGATVINMTQYPEVALAAEARIPYVNIALITDYDAGLDDEPDLPPVTQAEVFAFFESNVARVRKVLFGAIEQVPQHLLG
ncbi:MAG TPA: S-methyl-5'-thioadenosine phosphorylase [Acidimicrobiales bacterium]|nr:S-methyl-5'-thioadenosine phosphorylase [Acidimicrobiales bacterium]